MKTAEKKFILDGFTWSFSRVGAYRTCPWMFFQHYIQGESEIESAFAQYGTMCHSILEWYYSGWCSAFELGDIYRERFDNEVTDLFPFYSMYKSYYDTGEKYFDYFEDPFEDKEVIAIEKEFTAQINGYSFLGYIDLLLKDSSGIYIVDHKSKSKFKNKKEQEEYARQLYLYAECVKQEYGEYPIWMEFNLFRSGTTVRIPYSKNEAISSITNLTDTIKDIYDDNTYDPAPDSFFCKHLCGVRHKCCYGGDYEV